MGKKLTPNQQEFQRQTKRINDMMRQMEMVGYRFHSSPIEDAPERVSSKRIAELQAITPQSLKKYAHLPERKPPSIPKPPNGEAPHHRPSHLSEDDKGTGIDRRGGHGNPANLQHTGNPHGNPANLQHTGNPANLRPHPENLRHGGGNMGGGRVNKPRTKDTDLYGIIYSAFWETIDYDFKSAYGQTGRDTVAEWANHMIDKYGEEMFVIGLNVAASDGHVLSTEMMYDDALRLDFFMEVVKAINDQLGQHTGFEDRHENELLNRRDLGHYYGTNPAITLNERLNDITADSRYQQGEEENYYKDWD